jgi:glycosyltransferase involved in cell wall biosynthesis
LLRQRGHEVVLYARDNAEIEDYNTAEKLAFFVSTIHSQRSYREIRSLVQAERPDVAHVHNVFPLISPTAYVALQDAGLPIVQTIHNFRFLCPNALFYTRGENCERCKTGNTLHAIRYRCYRNSLPLSSLYALTIGAHRQLGTFNRINCYIALTDFVATKLVEGGLVSPSKVHVLGNFVEKPTESIDQAAKTDGMPYILYIGRLSHEKGVDVLVDAVAGLPLQLKIAGTGPEENSLRQMVDQQGLPNIEFLGHVTGDYKWQLIGNALATIVPSRWYENLPFVILESFASGTPVIAANTGSLPYIIKDQVTGLLFDCASVESLSQKLLWLLTNPNAIPQLRENVVAEHRRNYSVESHYKKLFSIYNDLTRLK